MIKGSDRMYIYLVLALIVMVVVFLVYREYSNEKKYQEEKRRQREAREEQKKSAPEKLKVRKVPPKKIEEKPKEEVVEKPVEVKTEEKVVPEEETVKEEPVVEIKKVELPDYPDFDHSRLLEMGLSDAEVIAYVKELIPQIENQIPLIKEAMEKGDLHAMEKLTHSIKGSSTTIGTGGISDLLSDFNTYLKGGTDTSLLEAYYEKLKEYFEALKKQYA